MKLNIPPLGQRDDRWKLKRLGNSTTTIGNYGCLLLCHVMMLDYFGKDVDPIVLNEIYKEKGVFHDGNLINFYAAADVYDDIKAEEFYNCLDTPCDLSKIDKYLIEKKCPVIAWVDNVNNDNKPDHFVLIIGKDEQGKYLINDPWLGETQYFHAVYGDDPARFIYGLRIYTGTPKNGQALEDQIRDLQDSLTSCNKMLAEKALEANSLRDALAKQEADNADLTNQLNQARGEKDKIDWEKRQLDIQVKTLQEEIDKLKKQVDLLSVDNAQLRIDLEASQAGNFTTISLFNFIKLRYFRK